MAVWKVLITNQHVWMSRRRLENWLHKPISSCRRLGAFLLESNFADVLFLDKNNTDIIGENDELHILGPYSSNAVQLNFCTREDVYSDQGYSFHGNICTFKVGTACSVGMCYKFIKP